MVNFQAAVLHNPQTSRLRPGGCSGVRNAQLHPQGFGIDSYCFINDGGNVRAVSEAVDQINLFNLAGFQQCGVNLLAQYFCNTRIRVDGYDAVATGLHVTGDVKADTVGLGRQTDHGDGVAVGQNTLDDLAGCHDVFMRLCT